MQAPFDYVFYSSHVKTAALGTLEWIRAELIGKRCLLVATDEVDDCRRLFLSTPTRLSKKLLCLAAQISELKKRVQLQNYTLTPNLNVKQTNGNRFALSFPIVILESLRLMIFRGLKKISVLI